MKLSGRRILITGGGSGIGLELARRLANDNKVVITGRDEERLARARADTPRLSVRRLDVTSEDEAGEALAWLERELGGLDVLVNNAGLLRGYALEDSGAAGKIGEDVAVNLLGALRMTSLALPMLRASEGGAVVVVPKGSPAAVAEAIVAGIERDHEEIRVGAVRQLAVLARIRPSLADRLVVSAFTPRRGDP